MMEKYYVRTRLLEIPKRSITTMTYSAGLNTRAYKEKVQKHYSRIVANHNPLKNSEMNFRITIQGYDQEPQFK